MCVEKRDGLSVGIAERGGRLRACRSLVDRLELFFQSYLRIEPGEQIVVKDLALRGDVGPVQRQSATFCP